MAKIGPLVAVIKIKWWFRFIYIPLLITVCWLTQLINPDVSIDEEKLGAWIKKGCSVRIKGSSD